MRKILIISSILSLAACDHYEEDKAAANAQLKQDKENIQANMSKNSSRVADNIRDSIKRTGEHVRNWWITPLPVDPGPHPMPTRYCYKVFQDVLCYRQQMPGWENKLVGYQGANAEPPTPATMKLIPLRIYNPDSLPEKRAENTKPVFPGQPLESKEVPVAPQPLAVDPTHETLPDSALSPQL